MLITSFPPSLSLSLKWEKPSFSDKVYLANLTRLSYQTIPLHGPFSFILFIFHSTPNWCEQSITSFSFHLATTVFGKLLYFLAEPGIIITSQAAKYLVFIWSLAKVLIYTGSGGGVHREAVEVPCSDWRIPVPIKFQYVELLPIRMHRKNSGRAAGRLANQNEFG